MVYLGLGIRLLDILNRDTEGFLAITQAIVEERGETQEIPFIAVNKDHIISIEDLGQTKAT